jgi:uncharacterized protein (DUF1800 family)
MNARRAACAFGAGLLAWCVALNVAAQSLDDDAARFLLTRTGFSPSAAEVAAYRGMSRAQAVDRLLSQAVTQPLTPPPAWVRQPLVTFAQLRNKSEEDRKAQRDIEVRQGFELRGWWLREMLSTPSPLSERMTLFWHNHFVSSQQKVKYSQLMYRQNVLLRQYAVGNFATMLHAVGKDPAMLIYLDSASNRKGAPNENFAREVMELFTLGEGNYAEADIKEAARAFTGWSVDPDSGAFKWRPFFHDEEVKTVLGRSGNFDGDAVLDILLAQPACAEYIVSKLWREFVSPTPDKAEVRRIAQMFRSSGYEIRTPLRELLMSQAFWNPANRGSLVKSPVEMMVGALKQFQFQYDDPLPFTFAVAQLGQNLFSPPNVKGWPGGDDWINSTTLLARKSILERLFRATEGRRKDIRPTEMDPRAGETMTIAQQSRELGKVKGQGALGREGRIQFAEAVSMIGFDPDAWLARYGASSGMQLDVTRRLAIQKAVLPLEPSAPIQPALTGTPYLRALVMDPVYQLK